MPATSDPCRAPATSGPAGQSGARTVLGRLPPRVLAFGTLYPAQTIVQGWLNAAIANQMGTPAAMGPILNLDIDGVSFAICDYPDYYWGKGTVGPNIPQSLINGWWYIQGTDAVQEFP